MGCLSVSPRERNRDQAIAAAFGQRVREARLAAGMSQEDLAEAANLHRTFVSNVERGYRVPSVVTLLHLAAGLQVEPSVLVDGLGV
jgi:transcriptional regulator with XRE-family HTH domain